MTAAPDLPSPWPHAAEAEALRAGHAAELARLERELFRGTFPPVLQNLLADSRTIADGYVREHAAEAARGWDAMKLLRELLAEDLRIVRRYANARP